MDIGVEKWSPAGSAVRKRKKEKKKDVFEGKIFASRADDTVEGKRPKLYSVNHASV